MGLPQALARLLEPELGRIEGGEAVGGGCVSNASRISADGSPVFLKYERGAPDGFFEAEARGLQALATSECGLSVPRVLSRRDDPTGWSWLAVEWLQPGSRSDADSEKLGRGLATLHRVAAECWGAQKDGFIGRLPQTNSPTPDWPTFWWERRLEPQLRRTDGIGRAADWTELEKRLPSLLEIAAREGASLLHGDLWGGNVVWSTEGPALIDPASYHGHREVDLAMMELFGGFTETCYAAYRQAWPLEPGYDARKGVYQLYYLLVHVNLFGASYVPRTLATLNAVLKHA